MNNKIKYSNEWFFHALDLNAVYMTIEFPEIYNRFSKTNNLHTHSQTITRK